MRRHIIPILLVGCTLLVAFWIVASRVHDRPFNPFNLTAADFKGYCPAVGDATVRPLPVTMLDPAEPNIVAYELERTGGGKVVVRLVHGYNMPMCLKIKGYTVELIWKNLEPEPGGRGVYPGFSVQGSGLPLEVWRVTASTGDVEVWVTTMIRSDDFSATRESVTSMAFPRVDIPDDPNWVPRGYNSDDLRHPAQAFRRWVRSRWNGARTDVLTFLKLRQPAWASEEILTYVSRNQSASVTRDQEPEVIRQVVSGHSGMLRDLQMWRRDKRLRQSEVDRGGMNR